MATKQSSYSIMLIVYLAVGIVVLAVGFFTWHTQNTEHIKLEKKVTDLERQTRENQKLVAGRPELEERHAQLTKTLSQIDSNLVAYDYIPTYLQQLQHAAVATGNQIQSIQPDEVKPLDLKASPLAPPSMQDGKAATNNTVVVTEVGKDTAPEKKEPEGPQYQVQQFTIEVRGTYVSLMRFLVALRQFRKLVYVRGLTLSPVKDKSVQAGQLSARLETYAIITPEQYKLPANAPEQADKKPAGKAKKR
jgi:Tfp pilus assembly protein PilO